MSSLEGGRGARADPGPTPVTDRLQWRGLQSFAFLNQRRPVSILASRGAAAVVPVSRGAEQGSEDRVPRSPGGQPPMEVACG